MPFDPPNDVYSAREIAIGLKVTPTARLTLESQAANSKLQLKSLQRTPITCGKLSLEVNRGWPGRSEQRVYSA